MAAGPLTQISDLVVPEIFTPYTQQITAEKALIIQSGAAVRDPFLDNLLAGAGLTFNVPSYRDLDNDDERVSTDSIPAEYSGGTADPDPLKTQTDQEIAVRLSRNNSWSSADLASVLAGSDPMQSIGARVGYYWARRLQTAFVATMKGVFADNDAAPAGTEHVQYDLTNDVKGASYTAGVTDFSAEAFIDTLVLMGDSMEDLGMILVHSIVYARMLKNDLIDFIPDSKGAATIPTFMGRRVVRGSSLPSPSSGVYESWLFGAGAVRIGMGTPKIPTEIERHAGSGNGGGSEVLYNRVEWALHPVGHKYAGTAANGGPSNAATTNNLAAAASWQRVFPEREQIKVARLITRES